jgi:hypothetical protein
LQDDYDDVTSVRGTMVETRKWAGGMRHSPPPQPNNAPPATERLRRNKGGDTITGTATFKLLYKYEIKILDCLTIA